MKIFILPTTEKPVKIAWDDGSEFITTEDCTAKYAKKLTPFEAEQFIQELFGTTNIGILHEDK